jgi:8-hydroxy-5-deazaflavin:NADPH oxidoreductase
MNVGIVRPWKIDATGLFADAGHDVAVSNSRGPEWLVPLVEETGSNARTVTVEEVADFGEVVLVAKRRVCYGGRGRRRRQREGGGHGLPEEVTPR